jgi:hypothetical protein
VTSRDLRYEIYSTTFEEVRSALAVRDHARVVHICEALSRLPVLERRPAEAAVAHVQASGAKRTREEFSREFPA